MFLLNCCPDDDLIFKKRWKILFKNIYLFFFYILDQKVLPIYDPYKIRKTESNIFEILWENSESCMKLHNVSFPNPNEGL